MWGVFFVVERYDKVGCAGRQERHSCVKMNIYVAECKKISKHLHICKYFSNFARLNFLFVILTDCNGYYLFCSWIKRNNRSNEVR